MFNNCLTANLLLSVMLKEFLKSVNNSCRYGQEYGVSFLTTHLKTALGRVTSYCYYSSHAHFLECQQLFLETLEIP